MKRLARAAKIFQELTRLYPTANCELWHQNDFQLLVATILSAQCTDERVNMVTPILFKKYPTAKKMAVANQSDIENIIRSTGFYRNKAKNIIECAKGLVNNFNGQIPKTIDELITLAGVGRKTANVVLGNAYNIASGIVVDTHVRRLSNLLKLTTHQDPIKIEQDLMKLFPSNQWIMLSHLLIFHGRRVCNARKPLCQQCTLKQFCKSPKN